MTLHLFSFFKSHGRHIFLISLVTLFLWPLSSFAAASYEPLVGIPGVSNTSGGNLTQYLNRLYLLTISVGVIIAIVKIFMAGIKWSMSDIVTDKSSAKSDIRGALLGLAILLVPYLVLNEIYPDLTNMNFLRNAPTVTLTPNPTAPSPGLANVNPNSTVAPAGMTFENCAYDPIKVTSQTDETNYATYTYDASGCEARCATKQGTFLPLPGGNSGRCTFKATEGSNTTVDLEAADPNRMGQ